MCYRHVNRLRAISSIRYSRSRSRPGPHRRFPGVMVMTRRESNEPPRLDRTSPSARRQAVPVPRQRVPFRAEGSRIRRGAVAPHLPRGLRDRDEPLGTPHPLRHPEPPLRHAGGAGLLPVARHGGADAGGGNPPFQPRDAPPGARVRSRRFLSPVRADLHEHPDLPRSRRDPDLGARPLRLRSARDRRRPLREQPGAAGRVLRPLPDRRRRGGRPRDHRSGARHEGTPAPRATEAPRRSSRHLCSRALRSEL